MRLKLLPTARTLRVRPATAAIAIACLALGIGANVAVLGVVDALLFRPPIGVSEPAALVRVRVGGEPLPLGRGAGPTASYPQFRTIREQRDDVLAGLAAYGRMRVTKGQGLDAEPLDVRAVTGRYFGVLGVRPRLGRLFDDRDGADDAPTTVAVLSHRTWRRAWGGDPSVLGTTVELDGVPFTVVGVAPEGFVGVDLGDPDLWVPIGATTLPELGGPGRLGSGAYWLQLVGRLAPEVDLAKARAMTATEPAGDPFAAQPVRDRGTAGGGALLPVALLPLRTMFFGDQLGRSPLPPWTPAVSLAVLLLACATVANLLLAEAVRRRREVAIRLAIGGSPGDVLREQLGGSLLLASAAGAGALLVASGLGMLARRLPVPPLGTVVSGRAAVAGTVIALVTPLLFGLAPALWAARRNLTEVLDERSGGLASVSRLQHALMAAQTAIGFVLLLVAALFLHSFRSVRALDVGMDVDRVLTVRLSGSGRERAADADRVPPALERIRRLPGVESAAVGGMIPFYLFSHGAFSVAGRGDDAPATRALVDVVGPDYFETLGITIAAGRPIDARDREGTAPVAVLSGRLARRVWPAGDALGACLRLPPDDACVEVVGIERDARYEGPFADPSETLYLAAAQQPGGVAGRTIFVRTRGKAAAAVASVHAAVQSLDPAMPWVAVEPLDARLRPSLIPWEVGAELFGALGALATVLAAVGLWMVVAFIAAQRRRELGIRAALGAGRARLIRLLLLAGLRVSASGLAAGAAVGVVVAALFRERLRGIGFLEPATWVEVGALLVVVAALASLGPATGASLTRPAEVLKDP